MIQWAGLFSFSFTEAALKSTSRRTGLILLAFIAFISLGMPDGLMGVAWPTLRHEFGQPIDALGMLMVTSTAGYMFSSFLSGRIMRRMGVGGLLAASCFLTGAGLLGYTLAPAWWVIVALGTVAGLGAGAIDAGINTYVASEHGEGLMQWLHASYGVGITSGPLMMTAGLNLLGLWRAGYWVVGAVQIALSGVFYATRGAWARREREAGEGEDERLKDERRMLDYQTPLSETLRTPRAWLSVMMFFLYVGAEASLGTWAYSLLTEGRGVASGVAGLVTGSYWAMFTVGRVLAGMYTRRRRMEGLLWGALLAALGGTALLWWNPHPWAGVLGVAVTGFAIAPIYPGFTSGTGKRVGLKHAANTIGVQVSLSGLGSAAVSGMAGVLAQRLSLEVIPPYLFGLFAALIGLYAVSVKR